MNAPLATLRTIDGKPTLRFERRLDHPPAKVWRAVTEPGEMTHWFPAAVEAEPRAGAAMRFGFDGVDSSAYDDGEVLEYDPPKVYAFRWADSVLRFEIIPDGSGCRLVFTHTLSGTGTHGDRASTARNAAGWDACMSLLAARLDDTPAPSLAGPWWFERAERYVEEFGLGEGKATAEGDDIVVRFERDLVQPVDEVWATLTATGDDTELAAGSPPPVQLTHGYVDAGAITELAPPHVVEYQWLHDGSPAGRVRVECRKQDPVGTRLVLAQTIPPHLRELRATALAAWQTHLELFFAALHGDVRCPWPTERTERLRAIYAERLD